MSHIGRYLPQGVQEKGFEIRAFMPRYGLINERRNQLHEVIRLSGMNLIIDDTDHPLIIKVASIQAARMQVYFIENEDYFHRKSLLDEEGVPFEDNDERAIFFARGVLETVKKLRWAPDIVHCHGWITNLVPLYLKRAYKDDPLFNQAKVVYSAYGEHYAQPISANFKKKLKLDGITDKDLGSLKGEQTYASVTKLAIDHSDGVIVANKDINGEVLAHIEKSAKSVLGYHGLETYIDAYAEFYNKILG